MDQRGARKDTKKEEPNELGRRKKVYIWSFKLALVFIQFSVSGLDFLTSTFFFPSECLSFWWKRKKKYQKIAANPKEPFYLSQCNRKCPVPNFLSPDAKFGPYASQIPNPVTLGWHEHTEISSGNTWEGQGGIQAQLHGQPGHCLEGKLRFSKETEIKGVVVFTHGTGEHRWGDNSPIHVRCFWRHSDQFSS